VNDAVLTPNEPLPEGYSWATLDRAMVAALALAGDNQAEKIMAREE
jgi:hypothetical protein